MAGGDSNFSTSEMEMVAVAFIALVILNGLFFGTGIFGTKYDAEPPQLNYTGQNMVEAGEFPDRPIGPNQFRMSMFSGVGSASHHELNGSTDILIGSTATDCEYEITESAGSVDTSTTVTVDRSNGSQGTGTLGEWRITFVIENDIGCTAVGTVQSSPGGDKGFLSGFLGDASNAVAGVFEAVVYLGEIILWMFATLFEVIVSAITVAGTLITWSVDMANYLVDGWLRVTDQVGSTSSFLPLLIWGSQVPMYLILFNAIMKVIKALPTT